MFGSTSSINLLDSTNTWTAPQTVNIVGNVTGNATTATSVPASGVDLSTVTSALSGKQATGNYVTALTGDVTASGPGSVAATVVHVPTSAVDLSTVTSALAGKLSTTASISPSLIDLSTVTSALSGKQATGNYITSLTGGITASGPGAAAVTIVNIPAAAVDLSTVTTAINLMVPKSGGNMSGQLSTSSSMTATSGFIGNASSSTWSTTTGAFDHTPSACGAGQYASAQSAAGVLTCGTPSGAGDVLSAGNNNFTGINTFSSSTTFQNNGYGVTIASATITAGTVGTLHANNQIFIDASGTSNHSYLTMTPVGSGAALINSTQNGIQFQNNGTTVLTMDTKGSITLISSGVVQSPSVYSVMHWATMNGSCTTGTCATSIKTAGITSITFSATGEYYVNFAAGYFTAQPTCTITSLGAASESFCSWETTPSTTNGKVLCSKYDGTAKNGAFSVVCIGQ